MFRIQVQEGDEPWHDVCDASGAIRAYPDSAAAHAGLAELYPILVGLEKYATGPKRTRVVKTLTDADYGSDY